MLLDVGILISLSLTLRCILKQAYLFSEKLLEAIFNFFLLPPLISISAVSSFLGFFLNIQAFRCGQGILYKRYTVYYTKGVLLARYGVGWFQ